MSGKLRVCLAVGLGFALALALGLSAAAAGQRQAAGDPVELPATGPVPLCDRYVLNTDGGDTTDCSDQNHPCRTIQYAVRQAHPGDKICVAHNPMAGVAEYTGTVNISWYLSGDLYLDAQNISSSSISQSLGSSRKSSPPYSSLYCEYSES